MVLRWSALLMCAFQISVSSLAQQPSVLEEDELVIDGIIVTGTKQDTTLQDLDVSATVIGREALNDARVTDIRRIDDLVPNVQFNDRGPLGAVYISIRGIESNPFIVNRAAVYIDGIPFRELNNSVLTQLESVEVLRGPQSTLYGANTESGLIVINTRAPGDEFTASSTLTASSFETGEAYQLDGYIAGPLIQDILSGSVSVRYSDDDFFVRNIGASPGGQGEIEEAFVQGRLRWTPTERLTINATGYIIDTAAPGVYPFDGFPVDIERYNQVYSDGILFDPLNPFSPFSFNGDLRASDFEFISDAEKQVDFQDVVAGISANYELDFGDVDLALSYRSEDTEEFGFDADLSNGPVLAGGETDKLELWNVELRYTSPIEDPLNYTIGVSYYEDDTANALGSLVGPGSFADYSFAPEQEVRSQDFGVFGSVSYSPPNVPKLTGTVGLRFDSANRKTVQNAGEFDLGFSVFVFDELTLEDTFEAVLPRFAVKYEPNDNLTFYGNIAKGYLPGGFNITAAQEGFQDDVVTYESEEMWSYEAGARWNMPAADFYVAAAAFYIDADNYQEISALVDETGQLRSTSFISSDASIESYGFEVEGYWEATDEITLTANLGIVEAEYNDFGGVGGDTVIGNPVKLIPAYDANIAARYEHPSGWFVRGEINFIGEMPLDEGNRTGFNLNALDTQEAVEIFAAQLGYEAENWSARLFIENAANERRISGSSFPNAFFPIDGVLYASVDAPRTIGLELGVEF